MAEPRPADIGPAFSVADALQNPQRILLVPDSRPGGLFIGASKFWAIRERYPNASLDLLAHRKKEYIAGEIPFIDNVILYDNFLLPLGSRRREVISSLRKREYDLAFCFRILGLVGVVGLDLAEQPRCAYSLFTCSIRPGPYLRN